MNCNKTQNAKNCPCTHAECSSHGICCKCLSYHLKLDELPACCFPDSISGTDERSMRAFAESYLK